MSGTHPYSRASARPRRLLSLLLAVGLLLSLSAPASAAPKVRSFGPDIDAYARYEGQTQCLSKEQPGVKEFRALLQRTYGANSGGILRSCSQGGKSEHKEGRAYDWMLNVSNAKDKAKADEFLGWLLATDEHGNKHAMARRFGIMYIIWNRRTWSAYRPNDGWQPYNGASPHTDHIHFSFSWDGAKRKTSYWTASDTQVRSAAPTPPPVPEVWYLNDRWSGHASIPAFAFGSQSSLDLTPLTGDWNGDGRDSIGVHHDRRWELRMTSNRSSDATAFTYGRSGDIPLVGDWDGDGTVTPGVRRGNRFYLSDTAAGGKADYDFSFGREGDIPVVGDWNGDGRDTVGVVSGDRWSLRFDNREGPADVEFNYGRAGDRPVVGDWNADGRDGPGVQRGKYWLLRTRFEDGPADLEFTYGRAGDIAFSGDWTGDGRDTPGVLR